jgi:putative addiction module component (TIGR02574 family)
MSNRMQELGFDRWSVAERLELIEQLWDSLPDGVDAAEVPGWHLTELARRREAARSNPGVGRPWREVLDALEKRS